MRAAESEDGLHWSSPRSFATPEEGFFDNAVARVGEEWVMILARGSNLHGTPHFPAQGLWMSRTSRLSADRADWSDPMRVLDTDLPGTPAWMTRGVYGPALLTLDGADYVLFVTGTRDAATWPLFNLRRLIRGQRPVVPSPFFLATGAIRL